MYDSRTIFILMVLSYVFGIFSGALAFYLGYQYAA